MLFSPQMPLQLEPPRPDRLDDFHAGPNGAVLEADLDPVGVGRGAGEDRPQDPAGQPPRGLVLQEPQHPLAEAPESGQHHHRRPDDDPAAAPPPRDRTHDEREETETRQVLEMIGHERVAEKTDVEEAQRGEEGAREEGERQRRPPDTAAVGEHRCERHQQQHRAVLLLGVDPDVRAPRPRRDLPVHRPDVVAGEVSPKLGEIQAAAAQPRPVASGQDTRNRLLRFEGEVARRELDPNQIIEIDIDPRCRLRRRWFPFDPRPVHRRGSFAQATATSSTSR